MDLYQLAFKSNGHVSRGMRKEGKYNYKPPHNNLCVSSVKLKQTVNDSLYHSKSVYVDFKPAKPTRQELWTL